MMCLCFSICHELSNPRLGLFNQPGSLIKEEMGQRGLELDQHTEHAMIAGSKHLLFLMTRGIVCYCSPT